MSNTNRTKGHNAERLYAERFRSLGYDKCQTSRYGSRMHDDCAIDLIFVPINVQIKAGTQRGLNPSKVLREMDERVLKCFPDDAIEIAQPNIVIHRKDVGRGKKRDKYDDLVILSWEDYAKLISND